MLQVIRRARRRLLANELLSQAANACGAALLGFILLLLAGAELLRWEWLLLLPAAAAITGVVVALKRLPSAYASAQIIDRRLGLADTLSTAWFFSRKESGRASAGMLRGQQEQADRISQALDVRRAIPFKMPRRIYAVVGLALLAGGLGALRYGITRSLDLGPPLARILEEQLGFEQKIVLAENVRHQPPPAGAAADDPAENDSGENMAGQSLAHDGSTETPENQVSKNSADRTAEKKAANGSNTQKQSGNSGSQSADAEQEETDEMAESPSGSGSGSSPDQKENRQSQSNQGAQSNAQRDANGSGQSSSLLSKMKDALENLLSRVKPQQDSAASEQNKNQSAGQQGKDRQNGQQQSAQNPQHGESGQPGDSKQGQSGAQAQNAPGSQSTGEGQSDDQQGGTGIGSQNGDKSIKQAEQLAAMGKISEIIGKRSADVSGEATVEVQSTGQHLKTPYAQSGAEHTQGGAEIDRDEIPVALEAYVEKYFEQVRKQAKK